jgi:diguanylate cyclase (GGDEF)-like protein
VDITTESAREQSAYGARVRRSTGRLAFGVAAFLIVLAALPVTEEHDRVGVLSGALSFFALCIIWFRIIPPGAFGDRRVMVFGILAQPSTVVLLTLTGGLRSEYFPFGLLVVIATVFSPRTQHTVFVAAATVFSLVVVEVLVSPENGASLVADLGTRTLETMGFGALAAVIGSTLRESRVAIAARADELEELRGRAESLALTDVLTSLYNRRFASDALDRLIADARRGRAFSIVAFDLDGFKRVNDSLGHAAGDGVLVDFAGLLRASLRGADIPVRMGGDEFLVLLPGADLAQATQVVERLQASVRDAGWGPAAAMVTVSCGVAQWTDGRSAEDLLQSADRALYVAKRAQRAGDAGPR